MTTRVPFAERGGAIRGGLDLVSGRFPRFVFGGGLDPDLLPVFHFHEVTREELEPKLRYLAENGYKTVTSDEIAAYARREQRFTDRRVGLCFDDAWASLWTVAAGLLREYGLTAITYAIPERMVDAPSCRPLASESGPAASGSPFVTWPELKALHASGVVDVQSHTDSHSMIFCSAEVGGFVTPDYAETPLLNRPQLLPRPQLRFVSDTDLGAPLYMARSRMSDARRVSPSLELHAKLVQFTAREGGARFFDRHDWRARLQQLTGGTSAALVESESDQQRDIEDELGRGRETLNARLGTNTVRHICLPWGISGEHTLAALAHVGYLSAFANRLRGVHAVRPGDDVYWLKRLPNNSVHLPSTRPRSPALVVSEPFPSDVGVAIVSHNNRQPLAQALASLGASGCPAASILVVDVASTDGTDEWLRREHPAVRVQRLEGNEGPNPARNIGIERTTERFVFLMDADVLVEPDAIARLRRAMATDDRIKIGSPIVVHAAAPDTIQYAGGSLHFLCEGLNPWMDRPLAERGTAPLDVGVASGNGLLIERQAAIDIGLFDERYFLGKDDGDFTHRMRMAGYRILEVPEALVLHNSRPRGTWLFYYQIRNRWHFMLKNYQWRTLFLILPCLAVHEPLQLVVLHAQGHGRVYWKAVGGLLRLLPSLRRDRALTNRIRAVPDTDLLKSDTLIIRDDLAKNLLVRYGKGAYEGFLRGYWRLLHGPVPAR